MQSITSRENAKIKRVHKLLRAKQMRRELGLFVCEGVRLCIEAVEAGVEIQECYLSVGAQKRYPAEVQILSNAAENCFEISDELAEKMSDTSTPQGVFCVCRILDNPFLVGTIENNGRYMALEGLQDPGNIGTILRTALALGMDGVFFTQPCPDLYAPKLLRSTMGAVFRQPVGYIAEMEELFAVLRKKGIPSFAAVLHRDAVEVEQADFTEGGVILIGNEGNGLSEEATEGASQKVTIPMRNGAESLNAAVAASILMWEMCKAARM